MIGNDWDIVLSDYINKDDFRNLLINVNKEYVSNIVFPSKENIFNAFKKTSYENVKVVILGQDPYHGENEAHGLSFSTLNTKLPPSLKNIYKELLSDLNIKKTSGDLSSWALEGVFLLNSVLTVIKDKPGSHKKIGWELFTDEVISKINEKETPVVFILWGNYAKEKEKLITNKHHLIIKSVHPSPFSARNGFFGSKPFSQTNNFLKEKNMQDIYW